MTALTDRFPEALVYCAHIHRTQTSKGKPTPYVAHLLSTAALVLEDGGDEDEAIAALLHDSLEDQPDKTSPEDIRRRFGDRVATLVAACSDTPPDYRGGPKAPWRQRKEAYLRHVRSGASGALRVSLADKVHNTRDMLADFRKEGNDMWGRFNAGKADQLWYLRSLVVAFRQGGAQGPLLDELDRVVSELERLAAA